jgi:phosphatidylserine/phosphatidylglycerophosphate/cardiolipin synthase-like enzyme
MQTIIPIVVNIEQHMLEQIESAEKSIHMAVAWFTSDTIKRALLEKKAMSPEVFIEIIVDDHHTNQKHFFKDAPLLQAHGIVIHPKAKSNFLHVHSWFYRV